MKGLPKVSIIIPVYNAEGTLRRCIDNILKQSFQDFEIILINDGSNDASAFICEEYEKSHSHIYLIQQQNAGPSSARNKGINAAKGEYITFIDSGDYVDPEFIQAFFENDQDLKNALVIQGYTKQNSPEIEYDMIPPSKTYHESEFNELFYSIKLVGKYQFTVSKLYDADLIRKNKLQFEEDITLGEDLIFLLAYLDWVNKVVLRDSAYYHYMYHPKSLVRSFHNHESGMKRLRIVKSQLDHLGAKYHFDHKTIAYNNLLLRRYFYRALTSLYLPPSYRSGRKERIKALKDIYQKGEYNYIDIDPNITVFQKILKSLFAAQKFSLLDRYIQLWIRIKKPEAE